MTGSGSGTPDRKMTAASTSPGGIGRQILIAMAVGLVFRLMMAYGFDGLRGSGFDSDLRLFAYWASDLGKHGPFGFYGRGFYADYTPGYLYALWLVGIVGQVLGGVGDLIKLPAILTDVALGLVVYRMARDLGTTERRATIAGAIVIFNPISWFDSVVWGQVDSFGTGVPAAGDPRAVEGTGRAVRDPGRGRGAHQAAARDPGPDHRPGGHPACAVAGGRLGRRGRRRRRRGRAGRGGPPARSGS